LVLACCDSCAVSVHDNIFVNSHGDAVRIQPHHAQPRRVLLSHNTIVTRGVGISVSGGSVEFRQVVVANAVFAGMPLRGGDQRWNVTGPYEAASEMLVAPFARLGGLDFSPRGRQLDLPVSADDDELATQSVDFYGSERRIPSAGAIAPGIPALWRLGLSKQPAKH
jgi:hypothetical protein